MDLNAFWNSFDKNEQTHLIIFALLSQSVEQLELEIKKLLRAPFVNENVDLRGGVTYNDFQRGYYEFQQYVNQKRGVRYTPQGRTLWGIPMIDHAKPYYSDTYTIPLFLANALLIAAFAPEKIDSRDINTYAFATAVGVVSAFVVYTVDLVNQIIQVNPIIVKRSEILELVTVFGKQMQTGDDVIRLNGRNDMTFPELFLEKWWKVGHYGKNPLSNTVFTSIEYGKLRVIEDVPIPFDLSG